MSNDNLRPCPFCGSTHIVCRLYAVSTVLSGAKTRRGKPSLQGWSVECLQCQASVHRPDHTEAARDAAIERWNTRSTGVNSLDRCSENEIFP
jgi:Lar family restriction alleviation protein